jgi:hypothetical protein
LAKDYTVTIAGKNFRLRYQLDQRDDIEQRAESGPNGTRSLLAIIASGNVRDQATFVWGGIKGAKPDTKLTPRGIIVEFQRHNEQGNGADYYQDIVCPAFIAACESKLLGEFPVEELKRIIGYREPGKGEAEDAAGSEPPAE